jgi:hypothetical protein
LIIVSTPMMQATGTHTVRPPLLWAVIQMGSGPIREIMSLSTNCMSVNEAMVATTGAASTIISNMGWRSGTVPGGGAGAAGSNGSPHSGQRPGSSAVSSNPHWEQGRGGMSVCDMASVPACAGLSGSE